MALLALAPCFAEAQSQTNPSSNTRATANAQQQVLHAAVLKPANLPAKLEAAREPLSRDFEENMGQTDRRVRFLSRGDGYTLFLSPNEAVLRLTSSARGPNAVGKSETLRMSFAGSNPNSNLVRSEPRRAKSNYFIGNNPGKWHTDIPHYGRVEYTKLYPGVDLVYYGVQRQLEYDLVLAPGADPNLIRIQFAGVKRLFLEPDGALCLQLADGVLHQHRPLAYQQTGSTRQIVEANYQIRGKNEVAIQLGPYDKSQTLVIDPTLQYSTYLGGNGVDVTWGMIEDAAGNLYVSGVTGSTNFPTKSPVQPTFGGGVDAFLVKLASDGSMIYSTFLGGSGNDRSANIAVDSGGHVYMTGETRSTNFPTVNPLQATLSGTSDAFITKFSPAGDAIEYSTYYGGTGLEYGFGIGLDAAGYINLSGYTSSTNFPKVNAFQPTLGGTNDAFAMRLDPTGSTVIYATYIGGSGLDYGNNLTVAPDGTSYIEGDTTSTNFPVLNALQSTHGGGSTDAFLVKISPSGQRLYATYLGGNGNEALRGGVLDANGNLYVTGEFSSTNIPMVNPVQASNGGAFDVLVAEINPAGSSILFSTYIGGSADDKPSGLSMDAAGSIYVAGTTSSANFPTVNATQATYGGAGDAFLFKLNPTHTALLFSTYLGGSAADSANQIGIDANGNAFLSGQTVSTNFPTVNPIQATFGGGTGDVIISRIGTCDFSFTPNSLSMSSTGGNSDVLITTSPECPWIASSDVPWVSITAGNSGIGFGTVTLSVGANATGVSRNATLKIAGQPFAVSQSSGTVVLTSISPASGFTGSTVSVTLQGSNFAAGATVYAGTDMAVSNVNVDSATQISATFTIPVNAAVGNTNVSVTSSGSTSNALPFTVNAQALPALTVTYPNSGEKLYMSTPSTLTWSTVDANGAIGSFDVAYSINGGSTYSPVTGCTGLPSSARSCIWSAPGPATTTGRIRVTANGVAGNSTSDASDANYSVITGAASITITQPSSALNWTIASAQQIMWNHNLGTESYVKIELSRDAGVNWEVLTASFKNNGATSSTFNWTVTGPATTQGRVRITWLSGPVSSTSGVNFIIANTSVTVTQPNSALTWLVGTSQQIKWNHNVGLAATFTIELSRDAGATFPVVLATAAPATTATTGVFNWTVTTPTSSQSRVRVRYNGTPTATGTSTVNFIIANPSVTMTQPNTALNWAIGIGQQIKWNHNVGLAATFTIELSRDGGATFPEVLATAATATTASTGVFNWTATGPPSTQSRVRVSYNGTPAASSTSAVNFIIANPTVTVTQPNTNLAWTINTAQQIKWNQNIGLTGNYTIELSRDGGATFPEVIATAATPNAATTGLYNWTVTGPATTQGRFRVTYSANPIGTDTSDVNFTIANPSVTVTQPNTNLAWTINTLQQIKWNQNVGAGTTYTIELSRDGGATFPEVITTTAPSNSATTGQFNWTVTGPATTQGIFRVTYNANPAATDTSNVNFTIANPSVTVTQPNTNLNWPINTVQQIKWNQNVGLSTTYTIELSRDGGVTFPEVLATAVAANSATTGQYNWTVAGPVTTQARFRVTYNANPAATDTSDVNSTIADAFITVASPSSTATNWGYSSLQTIVWATNLGTSDRVNVLLSTDSGATFPIVLATNLVASTKTAIITTPTLGSSSTTTRFRVEWVANSTVGGMNPVDYKVQPPFITLTAPNGPATPWAINTSKTITWTHNLSGLENVIVELSLDGGATYSVVVLGSTPCDGTQAVTVQPTWATTQAKVRIMWLKNSAVTDSSDQSFAIQ